MPLFLIYASMKSYLAKPGEVKQNWYLVDAKDQVLGRLAVKIANILRGRNKPTYTPHVDTGDFVVVINADKVVVTGNKESDKQYMTYAMYKGNERRRSVAQLRASRPSHLVMHAVKGMLPKNKLAYKQLTKLKVFGGEAHTHQAQEPKLLSL